MTTENETVVAEKPATHKKKAQLWLFALLGALLLFLVIDVVVKLQRQSKDPPKTQERAVNTQSAPQDSEAEFQRRLRSEEQRRAREATAGTRESPEETLARLRQQRDEQAQIADTLSARTGLVDPSSGEDVSARAGRTQAGLQKTPAQVWAEKEEARVLNSRLSSLKVQLNEARTSSAAANARAPATRSVAASTPREPLAAAQNSVQAEIARVQQLRQQLDAGAIDPEAIPAAIAAGGIQRTAASGAANRTPIAAERPGQVVGRPAAAQTGPQPGQAHLSVGTVIRTVLDQKVMSDYEGPFRCMVIDDVYDVTNRHIVIPKGSRCVGSTVRIRNINEPIQARMGLLVDWFVLPDGSKISMDRSAALDAEGVAAIKDQVNRHLIAQFLGVAAYALISAETSRESSGLINDTSFEGDVGEGLRRQFAPLAQKYLDLVPTSTLRPGTPMRIFIEDDIYIYPWSDVSGDVVAQARTNVVR